MSKDPFKELARAAREREEARARFEADPQHRELLAPITDAEKAKVIAAVGEVTARRARSNTPRIFAFAGVLAVAAALLVVFVIPREDALPGYTLEVPSMGYSATRSDPEPGKVLTLKRGVELEIVLRPDRPTARTIEARAFVVEGDEKRELAWRPEVASSGAIRFSGELGRELQLPNGHHRLLFAIEDGAAEMELEVDVVE